MNTGAIKVFLLVVFLGLLCGCWDPAYDPVFRNGTGTNVTVSITFGDGQELTGSAPAGMILWQRQKDLIVQKVSVSLAGKLIFEEGQQLIEKKRANNSEDLEIWNIEMGGLRLITKAELDFLKESED